MLCIWSLKVYKKGFASVIITVLNILHFNVILLKRGEYGMNKIGIRPFRKNDAMLIKDWCKDEETFYKWSAGRLGKYPVTSERLLGELYGRDDNDGYFPFTAFDENGPAGFFILRKPGSSMYELRFGFIIVNPDYRGKGYGRAMLALGIKYAKEIYGADRLSIGVFENNLPAIRCYKSAGFKETGAFEEYSIMDEKWKCIELEKK
jgi:RimJ/RimL family protein N-acetyltransferase